MINFPAAKVDFNTPTTQDLPLTSEKTIAPLTLKAFGMTDPGRVRPGNEDHFLIATLSKTLKVQQTSLRQDELKYGDESNHLLVVADGMGGHQGGEQASALALASIEHFILNAFKWFLHLQGMEEAQLRTDFQEAVQQADARLLEEGRRHPKLWGMGTTLTMAYSLNRELFLVHVGDSRCYLFREGQLHQATKDHTYVREMVDCGYLSPEEASHHRLRHVITNVVGGTEPGVGVEMHKVGLQDGDVVLLCSDGLTEMVPDQEIATILHSAAEPQAACEQLILAANEHGGKDNITAIVVRYEGAS